MKKPTFTIFYQFNPWSASLGGIQTIIRYFIKFAPDEFNIRLVGTEVDINRPLGKWYDAEYNGRKLAFFPLFHLEKDDIRHVIPTSVRYTTALFRHNFSSDFMHFHRLEPAMAAFRWNGEKTLFVHNDIHQQIKSTDASDSILWKRFPQAYFAFEKLLIKQFDQILSCNSKSTLLYKQQYPALAERVSFIRNSFDGEVFYALSEAKRESKRLELTAKKGLASDTRFLLFAGRLHPQKDPLLLIQSIAALNDTSIHLLIAGDGELAKQVEHEIIKLGLENRISMLGTKKQTELAELHQLASAFVLTSAYEGLPLVALEALACGTPIVTTDAGETPEILSADSGIVSKSHSAEAIANALESVLSQNDQFPSSSCTRDAAEYSAQNVIGKAYTAMWQRWEERQ